MTSLIHMTQYYTSPLENTWQKFKNILHESLNIVCLEDLQAELYQPFLPAGRGPSPGGCESCL